jgi:hypothetical protein
MSRHQAAIPNFYGFRASGPISPETEADFPPRLDVLVREKLEVPRFSPQRRQGPLHPLSGELSPGAQKPPAPRPGRSGRAKSSKLCKAIAKRPALRSRSPTSNSFLDARVVLPALLILVLILLFLWNDRQNRKR